MNRVAACKCLNILIIEKRQKQFAPNECCLLFDSRIRMSYTPAYMHVYVI